MPDEAEPVDEAAADQPPADEVSDAHASDETPPGAPKKRWFDRGLVWLGVVVVLTIVALAVSFLVGADETAEGAPPPTDITGFCASARALAEAPVPTINEGDASSYAAYRDYLTALRADAPPSIAQAIQRIEDSFQSVIDAIEADDENLDSSAQIGEALDAQNEATAADAAVLAEYIERHCGFSLAEVQSEIQATTPTAPDGSPAPTIEVVPGPDPTADPSAPSTSVEPTSTTQAPG